MLNNNFVVNIKKTNDLSVGYNDSLLTAENFSPMVLIQIVKKFQNLLHHQMLRLSHCLAY